jgi:hypothetical protein
MGENKVKGEMHGCIVCGRLHQLYVVYNASGKFLDLKVMSPDGMKVPDPRRPLVACQRHTQAEIDAALARTARGHEEDD